MTTGWTRTTILSLLAILIIAGGINLFQLFIYQDYLVPRLVWSVETLDLNMKANRGMWRACKNFGWCDEYHDTPKRWPGKIIWEVECRI